MTTPYESEMALAAAVETLADSRYAIALTGAGLSVESGIPSFRGADGLWTRYGQPSNLSYRAFASDPKAWWESRLRDEATPGNPTYDLKAAVDQATPNGGHVAIAKLEELGLLFAVITQNVDGLHTKAGSKSVLEIHGNRNYLRCLGCGSRKRREGYAMGSLPPKCAECGSAIKLDTVMFGEPIPRSTLDACIEEVEKCDAMLLVGTSGAVNPAAQFPRVARERGARIIEVNPAATELSATAHVTLSGPAGEILPGMAQALQARVNRNHGRD